MTTSITCTYCELPEACPFCGHTDAHDLSCPDHPLHQQALYDVVLSKQQDPCEYCGALDGMEHTDDCVIGNPPCEYCGTQGEHSCPVYGYGTK